jgi:hypothetical protein
MDQLLRQLGGLKPASTLRQHFPQRQLKALAILRESLRRRFSCPTQSAGNRQ